MNDIEDIDFEKANLRADLHEQWNINNDANNNQSVGVEVEIEAWAYMRIVRDQIAEELWLENWRISVNFFLICYNLVFSNNFLSFLNLSSSNQNFISKLNILLYM